MRPESEVPGPRSEVDMKIEKFEDIEGWKEAGCKTTLLGRMKCELCYLMDEGDAKPDFIVPNLLEAARLIASQAFLYQT